MALARTTAQILDLILSNAGEVTNGNSPYETDVLSKLNRVHRTLISGGTIVLGADTTVEIDENWPWAKAKTPLLIELQPPYTTGTVTLAQGSELGSFSNAPISSLVGYHLNAKGREEWYKIAKHVAGETAFELDGYYADDNFTGSFSAVKIDYALTPSLITVNTENNKIQFQKAAGTTLTGTLTSGVYTPADLATHVAAVMTTAASGPTITGAYSTITRKFTLTSDGAGSTTLLIVGNGDQSAYSIHKTLGFDDETSTAGLTQTGTYPLGGIARLIEPFRVHKGLGEGRITGLDSESFHRNFPLTYLEEGIPDRFCTIREDSDGSYTVRFNRYVKAKTRIEIEHVPVPRDLKDNSSSIPLVPEKHSDILEDAGTYFVMVLKSDNRAPVYAGLAAGKLRSMIAQYRGSLVRTGENFGRIIPRPDQVSRMKQRRYFHPTPTGTSTDSVTVSTLVSASLSYTDFSVASTTKTVTVRTLPANRSLFSMIVNLDTSFAGGSISSLTIEVGITGDSDKFIAGFDVSQATPAQESAVTVYYPGAATAITVTATAVGDNLSALTAGALTFYFQEALVG